MLAQIQALSVSRSVQEWLPAQPAPSRVLAVFGRTCLLSAEEGGLLSLVTPEVGDGPLNVVVARQPGGSWGVQPGAPASLSQRRLYLGSLALVLDQACTWEPRPPWPSLRAAWGTAPGDLEPARLDAMRQAPEGSLLELFREGGTPACVAQEQVLRVAYAAAAALAGGWGGEEGALVRGAGRLAGLGKGLTPAGDDFLAGLMIGAWLVHPQPKTFCRAVADVAAPCTTALSAAFLRAAARGECSAAWHVLLTALTGGGPTSLDEALSHVLAHGHTSGADMLAGFLWVPAHEERLDPAGRWGESPRQAPHWVSSGLRGARGCTRAGRELRLRVRR